MTGEQVLNEAGEVIRVRLTKAEFVARHRDFRTAINAEGGPKVLTFDSQRGTCLVPAEIVG